MNRSVSMIFSANKTDASLDCSFPWLVEFTFRKMDALPLSFFKRWKMDSIYLG